MDIVICGLDAERLARLKECCADVECLIISTKNAEDAHILITDQFFNPDAYIQFLKQHKGKRFILHPDVPDNIIMNSILLMKQDPVQKALAGMPPELKARYAESIYEKIVFLDELSHKISSESLKNIRNEVHKIAGSAGSFGYPAMTQLSRNFEQALNSIVEGTVKMADDQIRNLIAEYQNSLKLAFQNILHI